MSVARLKSLVRLFLLIGLPIALVLGLFGAGVYCGQGHRETILAAERWVGFGGEVAEDPKPEPKPDPKPDPTPTTEPKPDPKPEPKPEPKPDPKPEPTPEVRPAETEIPVPVTPPEPLATPELQYRLSELLKVRVKLVVDAELLDRRPDWIDYAQRHVAWASPLLERQLGVQLDLRGVVAWPRAWSNGQDALAALNQVSREDVDLVLALGGRSVATPKQIDVGPALGFSHAPAAFAFANPGSRAPHLRSLLRAVTQAMGGDPVGDPQVGDDTPIAFSASDRRIILDRKHLPFARAPEAPPAPEEAPDDAPEGDR